MDETFKEVTKVNNLVRNIQRTFDENLQVKKMDLNNAGQPCI